MPKRYTYNSRGDFIWAKQTDTENTGRPLKEIDRTTKRMRFFGIQHQITCIKTYNVNYR